MKIRKSGARYSAIVGIGEQLAKKEKETGQEYLFLNRGVNNVVKIDLSEVTREIDYNTAEMQFYAPNNGRNSLKDAINYEFFDNKTQADNILITAGGMNALNMLFSSLDVEKFYSHSMYWGAYTNIMRIIKKDQDFYNNYEDLLVNPAKYSGCAVIICDPNNPIGNKYSDDKLIEIVSVLTENNATVIWDGPYRRLFLDRTDNLYTRLLKFKNLVIAESFSKCLGISGQRLGFIHTDNAELKEELAINLLYFNNGVNSFSQILAEKLITTEQGKKAVIKFKEKTVESISKNISYLMENNLLAKEFYQDSDPVGIFVILNKNYEELLKFNIGSVPLNYFTKRTDIDVNKYARICVSVPHENFVRFFERMKQTSAS